MSHFVFILLVSRAGEAEICPPAAAKIYCMLGAGENDDEDDEELGVLRELGLEPAGRSPEPKGKEEEPLPPERVRKRRFALRVGALVTTSGEEAWNTGYAGELVYEGRRWEAGVEVSQVENPDVRSLLIAARAGYVVRASNGLCACLSAGAVAEQGELLTVGEKGSPWAGVLTVGAGYARPESAWEMRVSYNLLLGSTNAAGSVSAGAGVRF